MDLLLSYVTSFLCYLERSSVPSMDRAMDAGGQGALWLCQSHSHSQLAPWHVRTKACVHPAGGTAPQVAVGSGVGVACACLPGVSLAW